MDVGIGLLSAQRRPDDDRSAAAIYNELLELGTEADRLGFDSVWTSEHHFTDDEYLSGTMPTLGALAGRTDDVEIGSAVALTPLYDSVRLAEDAATIDALSDGRLTLGLSIGYLDSEFDAFGVPKDERVERTEDAIELLQHAWQPGPLNYESEFHPISPETTVTPTPDTPPRLMIGGLARPAVRRAARMGDGWCANETLSIDDIKTRQDDIEHVRADEGIDGEFTTYVIQHGFVGDSYEEAWETIRESYLYQQRKYVEWDESRSVEDLPDDWEQELEDRAIVGTPEDVREELADYRDALGDDTHFIFRMYHPGIGTDTMTECLERVSDEVLPYI
ncbi:LLM class flavin-dependent oxidoreductase [Candidatus Halobonum tyrrellensis]|uniref:Flavin-dependent oxidoreductase, F420-dependent methylene-tetrahydromethanopterin reductase n=1 Tax=Candidatus Halobonum tyrrellensis G22 TaxID=1324957 RepID=V4H7Z5_9EURY|nr:LLM class flavin-dependent oxidoreductase [Candidatus Halobonum tyrrellensis]ESP86800.1 flavin-dependent oxidoreductase, F420-dependent methylene-tetrahydromethanopterin reductase [Candidatus Halobonum tyrrellensis G22]